MQAEKKARQREKEKERKRVVAEKKAKAAEGARAAAEAEVATAASEAAALAAKYDVRCLRPWAASLLKAPFMIAWQHCLFLLLFPCTLNNLAHVLYHNVHCCARHISMLTASIAPISMVE